MGVSQRADVVAEVVRRVVEGCDKDSQEIVKQGNSTKLLLITVGLTSNLAPHFFKTSSYLGWICVGPSQHLPSPQNTGSN